MIKFFSQTPFFEPTHTRVGFYAIPLVVWIVLSMFYTPRTAADYILTISVTLAITLLLPAFIPKRSRVAAGFVSRAKSCSVDDGVRVGFAMSETLLFCGKMSCGGAITYFSAIVVVGVAVLFLYFGGYPVFLLTILASLAVDMTIAIVLYYTCVADLFRTAHASPEGLRVYNLFGAKSQLVEWDEMGIEFFEIGFGMTVAVVRCRGLTRYYILDARLVGFVKHHLGKISFGEAGSLVVDGS